MVPGCCTVFLGFVLSAPRKYRSSNGFCKWQYRMHHEICRFPSFHFYDGKLVNGDKLSSKVASFHGTKGLGPYVFFDVVDGKELHDKKSGTLSLYNECEADAAVEVLRFFKNRYISFGFLF